MGSISDVDECDKVFYIQAMIVCSIVSGVKTVLGITELLTSVEHALAICNSIALMTGLN